MENAKEILDGLRQPVRAQRDRIPAVFTGYGAMSAAVFSDGALDAKTKELIDGGPGTVHAPRAFAAFEEFATKP